MIEIEASNVLYFLLFRLLSSSHPSTYRSFLVHLKPGTQKCQCNKKKIVWLYTSSPWLQAQFFHAAVDNGRFFRMGNTCCCCHAARFILWWIVDVKCRKRERERKKNDVVNWTRCSRASHDLKYHVHIQACKHGSTTTTYSHSIHMHPSMLVCYLLDITNMITLAIIGLPFHLLV